jgi:hypothetical protein
VVSPYTQVLRVAAAPGEVLLLVPRLLPLAPSIHHTMTNTQLVQTPAFC